MKRKLALAVLLVAIAGGGVLWWAYGAMHKPLNVPEAGYTLDVAKGSSLRSVTARLTDAGLLRYPRVVSLYGRLTGLAARIQAGEYELRPGTTGTTLVEQLVAGRVRLHTLTILEGWTVRELLAAVAGHPAIVPTLDVSSPEQLASAMALDYPHAEGWFFPDTYRFPRGTTDVEFLRVAHDLMKARLAAAWASRSIGIELADAYQALILASIVERETALDSERPQVAGVFLRRLALGMRLQTDPTVIYGLGLDFDGNLTRRDLVTDTPYNTYTRNGLPPTPIALPGASALQAAVNPDSGKTLYFVATGRGDGSHVFTATLDEHNAAVARYLAQLRQRREE